MKAILSRKLSQWPFPKHASDPSEVEFRFKLVAAALGLEPKTR